MLLFEADLYSYKSSLSPSLIPPRDPVKSLELFRSWKHNSVLNTHSHWYGSKDLHAKDAVFSSRWGTPLPLEGNVQFQFMDHDNIGKDDVMFKAWVHTAFINAHGPHNANAVVSVVSGAGPETEIVSVNFTKEQLDGAVKDKKCTHFPSDFSCTLYFSLTKTAPIPLATKHAEQA